MSTLLAVIFPLLLLLAVPVAHALLIAAGGAVLIEGRVPVIITAQRLYSPTQDFPMLAIPFFILAGNLMMSGSFGRSLIDFAKACVGRLRGGLAQVSVLGSMIFGGVSGSAVADATALGNALIPVQKREGYPAGLAAAVNASSSTISVLIPPSIPLIIYGLVSETSIIDLFISGIVPAVMLVFGMLLVCWLVSSLRGIPLAAEPGGWRRFLATCGKSLPAVLMPVFVIATLRFGIATPTEVSVMAVAYALVVGHSVYRDLSLKGIYRAIIEAGVVTGAVMLIIMASSLIQWILTLERVPVELAQWVLATLEEPWAIVLAMNVLMLLIGTFLDLPAAILLLTPIFGEIAGVIGMSPVQLGVMMVLNLSIGLYTPPVGTTLFISTSIAGNRIGNTIAELPPFYFVAFAVTLLVSYVPWFSLALL